MRVAVAGLVLLRDGGGGRAGESCWQSEDGSPTVTAVPPPQDSAERDKERERAAVAVIPQSKAKESIVQQGLCRSERINRVPL